MRKYLPSVVNFSMDEAEVWVADNDSTDGSLAWLERECPAVRTLKLDTNYGFAEGYNRALRQIEAEYYVLLNSDVAVTPGWLTPLLGFMESHPEVAACQPKLLSERDRSSFEYAGACGGFMDRYGYPFCRGRVFDTVEKDHGQYDMPAEVFWTTGACMMIRSRDYWAVDGLDGRFFAHNEEIAPVAESFIACPKVWSTMWEAAPCHRAIPGRLSSISATILPCFTRTCPMENCAM